MAVKQNNIEGGSGSSVNSQNATTNISEKKTYDLETIINLINIVNNKQHDGFESVSNMVQLCNFIVYNLSKVPMPREAQDMKRFKENILKIEEFLAKFGGENIYLGYLDIVYNLIIEADVPSGAVSIVLQLFSEDLISKAISLILSKRENTTDESIRNAVNVLCKWLRSVSFCHNLNLWILAILTGLREQQKHILLTDIALDVIEPLFNTLIIPILRPKVAPVVFHLLSTIKSSPIVFHKIVRRVPTVIKQLKNDHTSDVQTNKILHNMVDVISRLMLEFQGYGSLYKEVEEILSEFTTSYDFQPTLEFSDLSESTLTKSTNNNAKVGLVNLGNTCYMNSVLQALAMTKEFSREILLSASKSPLLLKIQQLLALMLHSMRGEITPSLVLHATRPPGFTAGLQQDSSEFLGYLLEMLHEHESGYQKMRPKKQANETNSKNTECKIKEECDEEYGATSSVQLEESTLRTEQNIEYLTTIEKTFAGKVTTVYKCLKCDWKSNNIDTFRDLQLSFPELKTDCASNYSVQDLLDYYCSPEKLDGDNQYFCEKCKKLSDAERYINIIKAPKNLILTLKHFKYDQKYHMRAKLMHKVFHDENVSLKICSPDTLHGDKSLVHYSLYAAVVHSGFSMDSGHYYTFASDNPETWYKFNDHIVTTCSIAELHNSHPPNTPYILFYKMISKSNSDSLSSSNKVLKVEECSAPKLEELAPHLREFVSRENNLFSEENKNRNINVASKHINSSSNTKGNGNGDGDDEPPSACGGNALSFCNRFIY